MQDRPAESASQRRSIGGTRGNGTSPSRGTPLRWKAIDGRECYTDTRFGVPDHPVPVRRHPNVVFRRTTERLGAQSLPSVPLCAGAGSPPEPGRSYDGGRPPADLIELSPLVVAQPGRPQGVDSPQDLSQLAELSGPAARPARVRDAAGPFASVCGVEEDEAVPEDDTCAGKNLLSCVTAEIGVRRMRNTQAGPVFCSASAWLLPGLCLASALSCTALQRPLFTELEKV